MTELSQRKEKPRVKESRVVGRAGFGLKFIKIFRDFGLRPGSGFKMRPVYNSEEMKDIRKMGRPVVCSCEGSCWFYCAWETAEFVVLLFFCKKLRKNIHSFAYQKTRFLQMKISRILHHLTFPLIMIIFSMIP